MHVYIPDIEYFLVRNIFQSSKCVVFFIQNYDFYVSNKYLKARLYSLAYFGRKKSVQSYLLSFHSINILISIEIFLAPSFF